MVLATLLSIYTALSSVERGGSSVVVTALVQSLHVIYPGESCMVPTWRIESTNKNSTR
jgi:hypothetical protein